jgi:hypothetical protein
LALNRQITQEEINNFSILMETYRIFEKFALKLDVNLKEKNHNEMIGFSVGLTVVCESAVVGVFPGRTGCFAVGHFTFVLVLLQLGLLLGFSGLEIN